MEGVRGVGEQRREGRGKRKGGMGRWRRRYNHENVVERKTTGELDMF